MPKRSTHNSLTSPDITDEEVVELVSEEFPYWKLVCDRPGAEPVIIDHGDFEGSLLGMYCMYVAIRYAGIAGKSVLIRP